MVEGLSLAYRVADRGEALIRGLRSAREHAWTRDCLPARFSLLFDFPKIRLKLLEALHQSGQVVVVALLPFVFGAPFNALNQAGGLQISNNSLHLSWTQAKTITKRFLGWVGFAVNVPPVVGKMHENCQLRWAQAEATLRPKQ